MFSKNLIYIDTYSINNRYLYISIFTYYISILACIEIYLHLVFLWITAGVFMHMFGFFEQQQYRIITLIP